MLENKVNWYAMQAKQIFTPNSSKTPPPSLVDRPTQLICIGIFNCWVGGGNPCGAADFCISGPHSQEKQAEFDFFSKYPNYVHTDGQNAPCRAKNRQKNVQKHCFSSSCHHLAEFGLKRCATFQASPEMLRNKSGQTQPVGQRGWKMHCFEGVFIRFWSCF